MRIGLRCPVSTLPRPVRGLMRGYLTASLAQVATAPQAGAASQQHEQEHGRGRVLPPHRCPALAAGRAQVFVFEALPELAARRRSVGMQAIPKQRIERRFIMRGQLQAGPQVVGRRRSVAVEFLPE